VDDLKKVISPIAYASTNTESMRDCKAAKGKERRRKVR